MAEAINIGTSSYIGIGIMVAGGIIIPLAVCIWWLLTKKRENYDGADRSGNLVCVCNNP